ncbi:MAG: hypothetical protein ACXQS1_02665 [Methermicoccaceae archaeon]
MSEIRISRLKEYAIQLASQAYAKAAISVDEIIGLVAVIMTIVLSTILVSKFVDTAGLTANSSFYSQFQDLINTTGDVVSMMGYIPYIAVFAIIIAVLYSMFRRSQ